VHDEREGSSKNGGVRSPRFETNPLRPFTAASAAQIANLLPAVTKVFERSSRSPVVYRAALQKGKTFSSRLATATMSGLRSPEGNCESRFRRPTGSSSTATNTSASGQVAAEIRRLSSAGAYKGRGVKYSDEFIFRKEQEEVTEPAHSRLKINMPGQATVRLSLRVPQRPALSVFPLGEAQLWRRSSERPNGETLGVGCLSLRRRCARTGNTGATRCGEGRRQLWRTFRQEGVPEVVFDPPRLISITRPRQALADAARESGLRFLGF